jgi:hypothetical protein
MVPLPMQQHPQQPAAPSTVGNAHAHEGLVAPHTPPPPHLPCGEPPSAFVKGVPNILLIGDSISMGYSHYNTSTVVSARPLAAPLQCGQDTQLRLGYGLYVPVLFILNHTVLVCSSSHRTGLFLIAPHWFVLDRIALFCS